MFSTDLFVSKFHFTNSSLISVVCAPEAEILYYYLNSLFICWLKLITIAGKYIKNHLFLEMFINKNSHKRGLIIKCSVRHSWDESWLITRSLPATGDSLVTLAKRLFHLFPSRYLTWPSITGLSSPILLTPNPSLKQTNENVITFWPPNYFIALCCINSQMFRNFHICTCGSDCFLLVFKSGMHFNVKCTLPTAQCLVSRSCIPHHTSLSYLG